MEKTIPMVKDKITSGILNAPACCRGKTFSISTGIRLITRRIRKAAICSFMKNHRLSFTVRRPNDNASFIEKEGRPLIFLPSQIRYYFSFLLLFFLLFCRLFEFLPFLFGYEGICHSVETDVQYRPCPSLLLLLHHPYIYIRYINDPV